jgi:hypothetical protein
MPPLQSFTRTPEASSIKIVNVFSQVTEEVVFLGSRFIALQPVMTADSVGHS